LACFISFGHVCAATHCVIPRINPLALAAAGRGSNSFYWSVVDASEVGMYLRRAPGVVDGAGEEEVPLAVDQEGALVVGDDGALLREFPLGRRPSRQEERERRSGREHGCGPDGGHVSRS
jgi:hypothetical protein